MSGPQGGWGPGGPGGPPPKSNRGKIVAIVAGIAVLLLILVVGVVVLVNQSSGGSTPTATPGVPGTTTGGATTTTTSTSASVPPGQPALSQVFPDVAGSTCQAASPPARTQSGVSATESYVCDFSSAAPGARVIFARWPDAAGARAWYQDTVNLGPRIENFDVWQSGGVQQGPLYTAQSGGTVYSTGIYEGLNYSWEIRTSSLDQSNTVFERVQFRARTTFGG
jgi:serine/threonine-protein kinase